MNEVRKIRIDMKMMDVLYVYFHFTVYNITTNNMGGLERYHDRI